MEEDVDALAEAAEYWNQARYHLAQLVQLLKDSDIDTEKFREEFVNSELEEGILDAVEEASERQE
ncbi:MAG: hypothetical protein ABEJ62_00750 [Candidatus Nanohaloarchaea archaeon]